CCCLGVEGYYDNRVVLTHPNEPDAHRVTPLDRNLGDSTASDLTTCFDGDDLIIVSHHQSPDQRTTVLVEFHCLDAQAAPALLAVLENVRTLREATISHGKHKTLIVGHPCPDDGHRQQLVSWTELHARHSGSRPAHRSQLGIVCREANREPLPRDQQHFVIGAAEFGANQ